MDGAGRVNCIISRLATWRVWLYNLFNPPLTVDLNNGSAKQVSTTQPFLGSNCFLDSIFTLLFLSKYRVTLVNSFHVTGLFVYPLKTSENLKHTQPIRRQKPTNCLSVSEIFWCFQGV